MAPQRLKINAIPCHDMREKDIVRLPLVVLSKKLRNSLTFDQNESTQEANLQIVDASSVK